MSKVKVNIWGRAFELGIIYDRCEGEEILDAQYTAGKHFLETAPYGPAKHELENYILQHNKDSFPQAKIDNIFKYVMPKCIYVLRNSKHGDVAILCNYKFDMEHGLALIFNKGTLKAIAEQDAVL